MLTFCPGAQQQDLPLHVDAVCSVEKIMEIIKYKQIQHIFYEDRKLKKPGNPVIN